MQKQPLTLKQWAEVVHHNARSKGFYGPNETAQDHLLNLHSEVSEAHEANREGRLFGPSKKVPGMTCAEEELADVIIRAMGIAETFGIDIESAVSRKHEFNMSRPMKHGGKLV